VGNLWIALFRWVFCCQGLDSRPILQRGQQQRHQADADDQQPEFLWPNQILAFFDSDLRDAKKLFDAEAKRDQRRRSPDPLQHGSVVGETSSVNRKHG
jgi:hypothetical protein